MNDIIKKYRTMKQIGLEFGLTSHQVGKILKGNKLRHPDGKPTELAFSIELVAQKFTEDHTHYIWIWHRPRMVAIFQRLGLKQDPIYASDKPEGVAVEVSDCRKSCERIMK
jgi:hypothetical protein